MAKADSPVWIMQTAGASLLHQAPPRLALNPLVSWEVAVQGSLQQQDTPITDGRGEVRGWADDGSDRCRVGAFQLICFLARPGDDGSRGQVPVFSLEMT